MELLELLYKFRMDKELLSWVGNFINFLVLVYLVRATFSTSCFNSSQILISAFGLFVSIIIQLYNFKR